MSATASTPREVVALQVRSPDFGSFCRDAARDGRCGFLFDANAPGRAEYVRELAAAAAGGARIEVVPQPAAPSPPRPSAAADIDSVLDGTGTAMLVMPTATNYHGPHRPYDIAERTPAGDELADLLYRIAGRMDGPEEAMSSRKLAAFATNRPTKTEYLVARITATIAAGATSSEEGSGAVVFAGIDTLLSLLHAHDARREGTAPLPYQDVFVKYLPVAFAWARRSVGDESTAPFFENKIRFLADNARGIADANVLGEEGSARLLYLADRIVP